MHRLIILFVITISFSAISSARQVTEWQRGWKFALGSQPGAEQVAFDDSSWADVTIPHDWGVDGGFLPDGDGSTGKLPWKNEGWYRTHIDLEATERPRRYYLLCDGIMAFPKVYVNGELAGSWDYGYNSFYIDITDFLKPGEPNVLAIHADTRALKSRWYPGGGIYRKVQLIEVDPIHVAVWGTQILTPIIKASYADVTIATTVRNTSKESAAVRLEHDVYTDDGILAGSCTTEGTLEAGQDRVLEAALTLSRPRLWAPDTPHLYSVKTTVHANGSPSDTDESTFGVRNIRLSPDHGLFINGKRVQLRGVNLHHDQGPLGAAFYPRAMERQIEILKEMGCNAIRTSHNGPAPELLELCDRTGMLVFEEFFDKFDGTIGLSESMDFDEFMHRNIRNFVVRDRNHPSIFLWSVGNEMREVQRNENNGFQKLHTTVNYTRKYDPTRPVTMGCHRIETARLRHSDYYDVLSWNYGHKYIEARGYAPNKAVIISESASTESTRGFYELPLPTDPEQFGTQMQVSSYDLNAPGWAEIADDDFMWEEDDDFVAGQFVWSGFDYLGESYPYASPQTGDSGPLPSSRSSYFGIVDLCGIPKDRFFLYRSHWSPDKTTIHILPHWNWKDSGESSIPVFVYTSGNSAELFLNGKSLGRKSKNPKSENSIDRYRLIWDGVKYEPGELKAVAYQDAVKLGEATVRTTGEPARLRLTPDRTVLHANGKDLSYLLVEALDADGQVCPLAHDRVQISLQGDARIAGVGNGNPQSFNPFKSDGVNLFYGKAMIIIASNFAESDVKVDVEAEGLSGDSIDLKIK